MGEEKSEMQKLEENLVFKKETGWNDIDKDEAFSFAEGYKNFLEKAKTERESIDYLLEKVKEEGFKPLKETYGLKEGDRVYAVNKNKELLLAKIGKGFDDVRMTVSHVDSPRLDLKQRPVYEDSDLGIFDTHYYGGIKKYHWVNFPLALHGTVIDSEGEKHRFTVGEDEDDPVFLVPDLLPHLGKDQLKKKLKEAIEGEELNIVVGNIPVDDEKVENAVKLRVLKYLNDEYGFTEEDLVSAEIEAVPAMMPRDMGFDRSMVAAYGQDDRGLSYTSMQAFMDADSDMTIIAGFFDKEEIGSEGNTSVQSKFLEKFVSELLEKREDEKVHSGVYSFFENIKALSTDVSAAVNPNYKEVHDERNSMNLGQGVALVKFTGAGGKYSANDANAEFVGEVRKILNDAGVPFNPVELGKVDKGGGGTVAKFLSRRGSEVVDFGFPLLSMHSPYEVSSKADIYNTYIGTKAFYEE